MDSSDTNSVIGVLFTGAILLTLCIVLGIVKVCCKASHPSDPKTQLAYPVAISNRLFNVRKCLFHCLNRWLKTKFELLNVNVLIFVVIEIQKEKRSRLNFSWFWNVLLVSSFLTEKPMKSKKSLIEYFLYLYSQTWL